jgi:hypothetical protein
VSGFRTADELVKSAEEFARGALVAYHERNGRRAVVDAATALEQLTKACLVRRSPALLVVDRGNGNWASLVALLDLPNNMKPVKQLNTVGAGEALVRLEAFVTSPVPRDDLLELLAQRNGVIHAGENVTGIDRRVAQFAKHVDRLLEDLGVDRTDFWDLQVVVVDSLLQSDEKDLESRVAVKIAAAVVAFHAAYAGVADAERKTITWIRRPAAVSYGDLLVICPICESPAVASGGYQVDWDEDAAPEYDSDEPRPRYAGKVQLIANQLVCDFCGIRLDGLDELGAASAQSLFDIDGDPYDFEAEGPDWAYVDEDAAYERWTDK